MSRRTRMLEILAAADLVPAQLEQARMRGAREAQNADRIASLAPLLVDTGVKGLGMYGEAQNAAEQAKAAQIVASHAGDDVGDKTAGAATADVLASEYPSVDEGFFADPLGYKARAREGGRAAAATGLSQAMQASKQRAEAARLEATRIKEQRDFQQKLADDARADRINERDQARADAESERERADIRRSEDAAAKVAADERDFTQAQALEAQKQRGRAAAKSAVGGKAPSGAKQEKDALDIEIKKTALAKAKRDEEQAAAGKPLDDAQITKLAELGNTLGLLKSVRERAGGVDTGKVQQYRNNLAQMLGISDDGTDQFRADVGEALAQYIKGISGGAVSDSERKELVRNVPTFDDSDDAFAHKTEALERRLWNLRRTQLDTLKRAKRDVRDFADFMGEFGADAATAAPSTALDAAGVTKQVKLLQRVQELKGQGLSKEQARAILKREGLL